MHLQNEKSFYWLRTGHVNSKRLVDCKSNERKHLFEWLAAIQGYSVGILL